MTYPTTLRAAAHMARGYTSHDAGSYVRVECQTGHTHYVGHSEFQEAAALSVGLSAARAATRVAVTPSDRLSALLVAADATPPHPDTRKEMRL